MKKNITIALSFILLGLVFFGAYKSAHAVSMFITQQGGTGTTSPSGILYGDNGSTNHLNTVGIGTGLTFSGGTLSATASGSVGSGTTGQFPYYAAPGTTLTATSSIFLATSGYVGIGTTTPGAGLDIQQSGLLMPFRVNNSSGTSLLEVESSGFTGHASSSPFGLLSINPTAANGSAPAFAIGSSTGTSFVVTNAGAVGIGTAAPTTKLHVLLSGTTPQTTAANVVAAFQANSASGTNASIEIISGNNGASIINFAKTSGSNAETDGQLSYSHATGGGFDFQTGGTSGRMTILSTGLVGVASTTPWGLLSVNPTAALVEAPEFVIGSSTATSFLVANSGFVGVSTTSPSAKLAVQASGGTTQSFFISSTTGGSAFSIDGQGNVGIGFDTSGLAGGGFSNRILHISQQSGFTGTNAPTIYLWSTQAGASWTNGAPYGQILFGNADSSGAGNAGIKGAVRAVVEDTDALSSGIAISTAGDGAGISEVARFSGAGFLGVGTTSPGALLSVSAVTNGAGSGNIFRLMNYDNDNGTQPVRWVDENNVMNFTMFFKGTANGPAYIGTGTTTPYGALSVNPVAGQNTDPAFVVGSSSATKFVVDYVGNIGIGTTSPGSLLSIQGVANFSTATSTFYSTGGINITGGCFAINGVCVSGGAGSTYTATYPVTLTGSAFGLAFGTTTANSWSALQQFNANASTTQLTVTGNTYFPSGIWNSAGLVGIGTTSPSQALNVQGNGLISGNLSIANLIATGTLTVQGTGTSTFSGGIQAVTAFISGLAQFGNNLLIAASSYINFGTIVGTNGYGIRDNGGTIEAKSSGGAWAALSTASSTTPYYHDDSTSEYFMGIPMVAGDIVQITLTANVYGSGNCASATNVGFDQGYRFSNFAATTSLSSVMEGSGSGSVGCSGAYVHQFQATTTQTLWYRVNPFNGFNVKFMAIKYH